ncbi:hypothetical protein [Streptococcus anginosus]|nr:hypothetical protein [Streptococcus anginosus]UEB02315.1 hypothetical protein LK450_01325 [Streptococcus anginosus subsp. anginosus]
MKQRELAESIYGEENHTLNILDELKKLETEEIIIRHDDRHTYDSLTDSALSVSQTSQSTMLVPRPTVMEVEQYLQGIVESVDTKIFYIKEGSIKPRV